MPLLGSRLLGPFACCVIAVAFVASPGCNKEAPARTSAAKPLADLGPDDLRAAVEAAGFEAVTVTKSESGGHMSITVAGLKEDPAGVKGPDGKTRLRVIVSLRERPQNAAPAPSPAPEGGVSKGEGRRTLSVELSNRDENEAKRVLERIVR